MPVPIKVADRLASSLKQFQPVIIAARARDINESDTCLIVTDLLASLFGYNKYSEITSEFAIRGTFCDLAIKLDGKLQLLIEVKAIGVDLKDSHIKQAVDYAANQGADWVVLTNAAVWRVYRVHFGKPIDKELVLDLDLGALSHRRSEDLESLFLLCREAILKSSLLEYHVQRQALNRFTLAATILSEPIMQAIRRELRRISPGVKIESWEIEAVLLQEVLKREVIDGEHAIDAKRKVGRVLAKARKATASASAGAAGAADEAEPEIQVD